MNQNSQQKSLVPLAGEIPVNEPEIIPVIIPEANSPANSLKDQATPTDKTNHPILLDKPLNKVAVNRQPRNKNILKIILIPVLCFITLIILVTIFSITNIDTKFIKINLYGRIIDKTTSQPISNAKIIFNNNVIGQSDKDGNYLTQGLELGKITIEVKANGYEDFQTEVSINRSLLDYKTKLDISLSSSEVGQLYGKFITGNDNYSFLNDALTVNDQNIKINSDGTFVINEIKIGNASLKFKSINFKDLDQSLNIVLGNNKIEPIKLQPAGDITGVLKSWIKEDLVLNTQFYVENIIQNQVEITQDGKYFIRDLDVNKLYKIRVTAQGYKNKDYQVTIKQGLNELFDFKLVENGSVVYQTASSENREGNQFTMSDFDGRSPTILFNNNTNRSGVLSKEFYYSTENKLYFLSDTNDYRSSLQGILLTPYSIDLASGELKSLITNSDNLGILYPNYVAKRMINITTLNNSGGNDRVLQLMDLTGENRSQITSDSNGNYLNLLLSDNGKALVYENNGSKKGLFRYSVDDNTNTLISQSINNKVFDISEDSKKVLFARQNNSTGLTDLVIYDSVSSDVRVLKENFDGKQYRFIKGDNNKIIYFAHREDRDNIFIITIDQNRDDKISTLGPEYTVKYVYQQSGFIFYLTNRGLFIIDYKKPKNFKLVSDKVVDYTGYN